MERIRLWLYKALPGLLLIVGFGFGGFTTGFMIGASATPVVGAILPALISAISAGAAAYLQVQGEGSQDLDQTNRRHQIAWVGGIMTVFFLLYFGGLFTGILVRTTHWGVGRPMLSKAMREQVLKSDVAQALYRLDLYRALQSQGLSDADAASFVEKHFNPNYVLVPKEWLDQRPASNNQAPAEQSRPAPEIGQPSPKPDPYIAWPDIKEHVTPTPPLIEGKF